MPTLLSLPFALVKMDKTGLESISFSLQSLNKSARKNQKTIDNWHSFTYFVLPRRVPIVWSRQSTVSVQLLCTFEKFRLTYYINADRDGHSDIKRRSIRESIRDPCRCSARTIPSIQTIWWPSLRLDRCFQRWPTIDGERCLMILAL